MKWYILGLLLLIALSMFPFGYLYGQRTFEPQVIIEERIETEFVSYPVPIPVYGERIKTECIPYPVPVYIETSLRLSDDVISIGRALELLYNARDGHIILKGAMKDGMVPENQEWLGTIKDQERIIKQYDDLIALLKEIDKVLE